MDNKNVFARNLQRIMDINGKTRRDVCRDLGFNYSTYSDWVSGKKYPRMDKVELLAKYFGVTKSEFIENEQPTGTTNTDELNLSEEARKFLVVFDKLNYDQKDQLYRLALTIVGEEPQPL